MVQSLAESVPADLKRQQLAEVARRREEILNGKTTGIPIDQVIAEIQALLK